jgi:hypothetical protein
MPSCRCDLSPIMEDKGMFCGQCQKELTECTCTDLNDRMRDASDSEFFAAKWCMKCDCYYTRCKCEHPEWAIRSGGKLIKLVTTEELKQN